MKTIWKYTLRQTTGTMEIQVPVGSKILSVYNQYQQLIMYIEVDPDKPKITKTVLIVETGKEIESDNKEFIGSVLFDNGSYVLHVYEVY